MQEHYERAALRAFEFIFGRAMGQLDRCHLKRFRASAW
jgi:hypothetical protein